MKKIWSETDDQKLVEGLKEFGDDWEKIALHIGNKNVK